MNINEDVLINLLKLAIISGQCEPNEDVDVILKRMLELIRG